MVSKAERAHVMLTWAGCFEERRSLSLLGQLYESLVESVVIAGVTTIQMSEKGQRGNSEAKHKQHPPRRLHRASYILLRYPGALRPPHLPLQTEIPFEYEPYILPTEDFYN